MMSEPTRRLRALPSRSKQWTQGSIHQTSASKEAPRSSRDSKLHRGLNASESDQKGGVVSGLQLNTTKISGATKVSLPNKTLNITIGQKDVSRSRTTWPQEECATKAIRGLSTKSSSVSPPLKIRHQNKNKKREIKAIGKYSVHLPQSNRHKVKSVQAALVGPSSATGNPVKAPLSRPRKNRPETRESLISEKLRDSLAGSSFETRQIPDIKRSRRFNSGSGPCRGYPDMLVSDSIKEEHGRQKAFISPCQTPVTRIPFESPVQSSNVASRVLPSMLPVKLFEEDVQQRQQCLPVQQIVTPLFQRVQAIDSCDNIDDFSSDEDTSDEAYEQRHQVQEQKEVYRAMLLFNPKLRKQQKKKSQQEAFRPDPTTTDICVDFQNKRQPNQLSTRLLSKNEEAKEKAPAQNSCKTTAQERNSIFFNKLQDDSFLKTSDIYRARLDSVLICSRVVSQSTA